VKDIVFPEPRGINSINVAVLPADNENGRVVFNVIGEPPTVIWLYGIPFTKTLSIVAVVVPAFLTCRVTFQPLEGLEVATA